MQCVSAQGVSWSTATGQIIIDKVSISLGREKTGLVGQNGSGKTTLIRLLVGELEPSSGVVERFCKLAYLRQSFELNPDDSVAEVLGISEQLSAIALIDSGATDSRLYDAIQNDWSIANEARVELSRFGLSGVPFDRRMRDLSGGETTKVLLASLLLKQPDFIVLDEPTNNLDRDSRNALYEFIRRWTGGALIASHDRTLLSYVDQIAELFGTKLRLFGGNFDNYAGQRNLEEHAAARNLTDAKQALSKITTTAQKSLERQQRRSSRGKKHGRRSGEAKIVVNALRGRSQKTTSRLVAIFEKKIEQAEQNLEEARRRIRPENRVRIALSETAIPRSKLVVRLDDVSFKYGLADDENVIASMSFAIMGREKVAITGPNGCGKTTLLKLIAGELTPQKGSVVRGAAHAAYLPQNTLVLDNEATLLSNFQRCSGRYNENTAREFLSGFLFYGLDPFKRAKALSGGERLRLALAGVLCREHPPDLLLLDEPANHLDLKSIEQVESTLHEFRGTLIVVSHDERFLLEVGVERELAICAPSIGFQSNRFRSRKDL